tara:strand:+ start:2502 stop:3266 length:765 start_codon:yes stop_codon:yes gene_type:complete
VVEVIWLQFDIIFPAFVAGMLVLLTHVPMGQEVLRRGIIFLDLAIAQVAALGVVVASAIGVHSSWLQQVLAMLTAIGGALMLAQLRRFDAKIQEAIIGILFVLAATGSILLLAKDPHGGERLTDMLVGQILWLQWQDLILASLVYVVVMAVWHWGRKRSDILFYPIFAITITLSTQLVGVYLVFCCLIIPALATLNSSNAISKAYGIGALGFALGLSVSVWWDLPSGAAVVWALSATALAYSFLVRALTSGKVT